MKRVSKLGLVLVIATTAGTSATSVMADEVKCGSVGATWNVPRGAVAVVASGNDPTDIIAGVMTAIKETQAHSILSHGPNVASQGTRTHASIKSIGFLGFKAANCTSPLDAGQLGAGGPGAERVSVSAIYANQYGNDPLTSPSHTNIQYYDALEPTAFIAGECKNPVVNYATGDVTCAPIPHCANPRTRIGTSRVTCDATPGCGSPYVLGNVTFCTAGAAGSTCATGGHIDPVGGALECLGFTPPDRKCTQLKPPSPICKRACSGTIGSDTCPDGPPPGCDAVCLAWIDIPPVNQDASFAVSQIPLPLSAIPSRPNEGLATVAWLESAKTTTTPQGFQSYGIPYDFYQYMNINGSNGGILGTPPPGHTQGLVCSTFISYAYANGGNAPLPPYRYTHDDLVAASQALYHSVYNECMAETSSAERTAFTALCSAQGHTDACDAVANQVLNCFATGNCADDHSATNADVINNPNSAPYSISPDYLVGIGRHAGKSPTPWARDVAHMASFSSVGSTYGCWE
jgi:hypothetical protein